MNDKIPLQDVDKPDDAVQHVETEVFDLYEKREKIYTRKIKGYFQKSPSIYRLAIITRLLSTALD